MNRSQRKSITNFSNNEAEFKFQGVKKKFYLTVSLPSAALQRLVVTRDIYNTVTSKYLATSDYGTKEGRKSPNYPLYFKSPLCFRTTSSPLLLYTVTFLTNFTKYYSACIHELEIL